MSACSATSVFSACTIIHGRPASETVEKADNIESGNTAIHFVCRYDPGVLLSAIGRYLPSLASGGTDAMKLTGPFSKVRR
jgi:hypothetical protein